MCLFFDDVYEEVGRKLVLHYRTCTPGRLAAKLNRHGIRIRRGRNSTLAALTADIPAAALS